MYPHSDIVVIKPLSSCRSNRLQKISIEKTLLACRNSITSLFVLSLWCYCSIPVFMHTDGGTVLYESERIVNKCTHAYLWRNMLGDYSDRCKTNQILIINTLRHILTSPFEINLKNQLEIS